MTKQLHDWLQILGSAVLISLIFWGLPWAVHIATVMIDDRTPQCVESWNSATRQQIRC